SEALKEQATWDELFAAHAVNETAATRCIGLVIETRPDEINEEEVIRIRKLGATKVQIGIQSLNDSVLQKNKRGHTSKQTRYAINLLRRAGFKIHAHWMPNLYGSTPTEDMKDFDKLFSDLSIRPDELKVYPCSLIQSAELMRYYEDGLWKPYEESELLSVLVHVFKQTPRYCRLTRVIRDIPGTDIVVGNKKTNFRQLVEEHLVHEDIKEIRGREIKDSKPDLEALKLTITKYPTKVSTEFFLEYVTDQDKLAAFLRLSLPKRLYKKKHFISDLVGAAIIREVHVYGSSLEINKKTEGVAQHIGLGAKLIDQAKQLSKKHRFSKIAVISSIGTKEYYKKHCFNQAGLFQVCEI
ncbi:radical SAM protein, partial [Patescibacteria group bacterium]|nr:radical SAM protein [Patescibacteria group bacterium]